MPKQNTELTPAEAWKQLSEGNERFATNTQHHPNLDGHVREALRAGQNPIAVVLACSDSRVPVELIFDAGLGDVFVVRTAGEILGESVVGSVEFAVNGLGVPLVIVLGHESCGAIKASVDALDGGVIPGDNQRTLIERVAPSILAARADGATSTDDFERRHVAETLNQLLSKCPSIELKLASGKIGMVGARYQLSDGRVETLVSHGV